ncbi:MAG TPA: FkbM family methyltransferase [Pyrinomonadaceae bacterium]
MSNFLRKSGRFLFGKILPRAAYPVVTGPMRGTKFILGALAGEGGGASVYFNGMETEQTAAMLAELGDGKVFFDIGANVGYYTVLASRSVGRAGAVVAFEPVVRNLVFLQRHVNLNNADNVRILPFALSEKSSIASFSLGQNSAMGHLADSNGGNNGKPDNLVYVPTVSLDEIAAKLNLVPDVMKIDVEGAEMEVFRGGRETLKKARPAIFLSTHSPQLRTDCLSFLREIGYKIESLLPEDADSHEFLAKFPAK